MAPPQLNTNITIRHKFRFRCTTATSYVITSDDVLGALGTSGISGSACVALMDSFRVVELSMWAPPPSQGSTATVAVEWNGQAQANSVEYSDTTVSTAQPAYIRSSPPSLSLAGFWQSPKVAVATLFTVTTPVSTILDLTVDMILGDTGAQGFSYATASAADGVIGYLALDGYASNKLQPIGLTSHA
jgi:hypothetical protein